MAVTGGDDIRSIQIQQELDALDNAIHQEQWESARTRLAQLLERWPDDLGVRHDAAMIAAHDQQWDQAQMLWEAILQEQPAHTPALIGMAHVAVHQAEWTVAAHYARQAMKENSRYQADARRILIVALARQIQDHLTRHEWPLVSSPALELWMLDLHYPVALTSMGMMAVAETPLQKADGYFREALQHIEEVPKAFRAQMLFNLGNVLYRQQRYDEGIEWLEQAYQEHPDSDSTRNGVMDGWTQVLEGALRRRDWDRVHHAADRLLSLAPNDPVALHAMGLWYWHAQHDGRQAFDAFRRVFDNTTSPRASSTTRAQAAINAGQVALARGRTFTARRWFLNARVLEPQNSSARQGLQAVRNQLAVNAVMVCLTWLLVASLIFHW